MKQIDLQAVCAFISKLWCGLLVIFLLVPLGMNGQDSDTLSATRYQMADKLKWSNISKHLHNINLTPNWKGDNSGFWFVEKNDDGVSYKHLDFNTQSVADIFDHEGLSNKLNEQFNLETNAKSLGLNDLNFLSKAVIGFAIGERKFKFDMEGNVLTEKQKEAMSDSMEAASPNGRWIAFVKDHNLYVRKRDGDEEIQLSTAGTKQYEYASRYGWFDQMEGEGGERPAHLSINWSPDSKQIYCNIVDLRNASKMYMLDHSIDSLYRPKLLSYYRGSPGDTDIVYYKPVVFDIEKKCETLVDIDPVPHFMGIYPTWSEDGSKLYLTHWDRGFLKARISEVDLETGSMTGLHVITSDIGIEYAAFVPYYSGEHDLFVFTSEESGWKQLYYLDPKTKKVTSITSGEYFIDDVEHIDQKTKVIYFTASGKESNTNPYHSYLYRVGFDGTGLKLLTPEDAHHDVSISKDGKYMVDNFSRHDQATRSVLRDTETGSIINTLSAVTTTYLDELGWESPQAFKVKAGDGVTDIYGVLYKPTDFDPNKSYPIIDATYTGPHTNRFPSSYYSTVRSNALAIAELGFVVIRVDGRGSNGRSKAFRSYSYKNLGGGLDDHVVAIKTLGKQNPWIDTTRVGIFGHSAGGYDAGRALLAYPDFYKVGVASSADHDHRMEKAWWPEMYMGWPVGDEYHNQSNITNAKNLKGKLLLVHGALDDNVNISATMKLSEALVKADKEFDLVIFPSQRHGYRGKFSDYFAKKRWNYFVEHLLGVEPRWDWDVKDP